MLDGFDRGPTHEPGSLFGDGPPLDGGVGLTVPGCESGPAGEVMGTIEAAHVAHLGHEHRGKDGAHARNGLEGLPAPVLVELAGQEAVDHEDLFV